LNLERTQNIKEEFKTNGSNYHNGSQPYISDSSNPKLERNLPKLSVIIPVYQEEKILDETLSLFCKEMRKKYDFELIVSDGGSTDATVQIAHQHCDKVEVHTLERRQTIAEGRNMGAKSATGDILIFINADTFPANFDVFFETIIKWFQSKNYRKYDALACYVSAFPEEEKLKDRIFYKIHNNYVKLLNLMGLGMGRGECQIVKRQLFEEIGGYNSKLKFMCLNHPDVSGNSVIQKLFCIG